MKNGLSRTLRFKIQKKQNDLSEFGIIGFEIQKSKCGEFSSFSTARLKFS